MKERDILDVIRAGDLSLPPVELSDLRAIMTESMDGLLQARWNGRGWQFAIKVRARSTPKTLRDAIQSMESVSLPPRTYPLLVVPFLNEEQLDELAAKNVSGVDLNGNGVLVVPGELLVLRTGKPNRYPEKSALKNVYRGKVSLAARVFLLRPHYRAVGEIRDEILARGGELALSTVSKVLARLEEDLIVSRDQGGIRLVQPQKLLDALVRQYESPKIARRVSGKTSLDIADFTARLSESVLPRDVRIVPTGTSSISAYAVMARQGPASFYCTDVNALERSGTEVALFEETERFANVVLEETRDETVYFDIRENGAGWASPIQVYLELMAGDKRDRETAAQIAGAILKAVA